MRVMGKSSFALRFVALSVSALFAATALAAGSNPGVGSDPGSGIGSGTGPRSPGQDSQQGKSSDLERAARIAQIKAEIRELALANISRTDNRVEVRQQLNLLVLELQSLWQVPSTEVVSSLNQGAWRQIWADESNPEPPGFTQDFTQVYQTITPFGFGYNFGLRRGPNGPVLFLLRVEASLSGVVATAEITKSLGRPTILQKGEDLMALTYQMEAGTAPGVVERTAGRFPRGPIGARSQLTVNYLDQDLKIGVAPNSYTGFLEMFVLERVISPVLP